MPSTCVESLRVSDGRVSGAQARGPGDCVLVFEANATVLAGGDYSASTTLLKELVSDDAARLSPVNSTATGDGQRLGWAFVSGRIAGRNAART